MEDNIEIWYIAAKEAILVALLNEYCVGKYDINIKRITGRLFLDTNNAAVGVAAIGALWKYFEQQPNQKMIEKIDNFVFDNWRDEINVIPEFQELFID